MLKTTIKEKINLKNHLIIASKKILLNKKISSQDYDNIFDNKFLFNNELYDYTETDEVNGDKKAEKNQEYENEKEFQEEMHLFIKERKYKIIIGSVPISYNKYINKKYLFNNIRSINWSNYYLGSYISNGLIYEKIRQNIIINKKNKNYKTFYNIANEDAGLILFLVRRMENFLLNSLIMSSKLMIITNSNIKPTKIFETTYSLKTSWIPGALSNFIIVYPRLSFYYKQRFIPRRYYASINPVLTFYLSLKGLRRFPNILLGLNYVNSWTAVREAFCLNLPSIYFYLNSLLLPDITYSIPGATMTNAQISFVLDRVESILIKSYYIRSSLISEPQDLKKELKIRNKIYIKKNVFSTSLNVNKSTGINQTTRKFSTTTIYKKTLTKTIPITNMGTYCNSNNFSNSSNMFENFNLDNHHLITDIDLLVKSYLEYIYIYSFFSIIIFSNIIFLFFIFKNNFNIFSLPYIRNTSLFKNRYPLMDAFTISTFILILIKLISVIITGFYPYIYANLGLLLTFTIISYYYNFMEKIKIYIVKYIFSNKTLISYRTLLSHDSIEDIIENQNLYNDLSEKEMEKRKKEFIIKTSIHYIIENLFYFFIFVRLAIISEPYLFMLCRFFLVSFLILNKEFFFIAFFGIIIIFSRILFHLSDSNMEKINQTMTTLYNKNEIIQDFDIAENGEIINEYSYIENEFIENPSIVTSYIIVKPTWRNAKLIYYLSIRDSTITSLCDSTESLEKKLIQEYLFNQKQDELYIITGTFVLNYYSLILNNLKHIKLSLQEKKNIILKQSIIIIFLLLLFYPYYFDCITIDDISYSVIFNGSIQKLTSTVKKINNSLISKSYPNNRVILKNELLAKNKINHNIINFKIKKNIDLGTKDYQSLDTHYTLEGVDNLGRIVKISIATYKENKFSIVDFFKFPIEFYKSEHKENCFKINTISGKALIIDSTDKKYKEYLTHYENINSDAFDQTLAEEFNKQKYTPLLYIYQSNLLDARTDKNYLEFEKIMRNRLYVQEYTRIYEIEFLLNSLSSNNNKKKEIIEAITKFCHKLIDNNDITIDQKNYCKHALICLNKYKKSLIFLSDCFSEKNLEQTNNISKIISNLNNGYYKTIPSLMPATNSNLVISEALNGEKLYLISLRKIDQKLLLEGKIVKVFANGGSCSVKLHSDGIQVVRVSSWSHLNQNQQLNITPLIILDLDACDSNKID